MQIIASNYGCYFDEYQRTYPPEFHDYSGYTETHMRLADEVSQGELSEICFQGVRIHYGQFQTSETDTIRTTEDFPSVEMMFKLKGQTSWQSSVLTGFSPREHNLSYRPYTDIRSRFSVGTHCYVGIQLTETFFSRFADDNSPTLSRFLNHLSQRSATSLLGKNLPITPALQVQLTNLTQPNRPQPLKRLYLETTVLDLLRQQLEQAGPHLRKPHTTLSASDVDKIFAVKALLETNPLGSYSLLQVARSFGLNDYKLKKGFRDLFSTSVFGYLNNQRMQYAHRLLLDTDRTIGTIADELGYSESHHFSEAFKRRFGYLPSQLNRKD